ncbi:MAG: hypothetical protein JWR34_198 [Mycobacterium sp.]|jgi:hypothetical protein|nr:hypothetical protein [Mycobacterium sp.]
MDNNNIHRVRGKLKALAATVGVGVFITMGVVTLTNQTTSVGTNSDTWKADTTLTITSPAPLASVAPTIKSAYCKDHSPHAWADGCPF